MPPADRSPPSTALLDHLRAEEQLLREAAADLADWHAAVTRGDQTVWEAAAPRQAELAAALAERAAARQSAATTLAVALGLSPDGARLAELADRLPEPEAAELRAARDRLAAAAAGVAAAHRRNANLVRHLRSFFRGVVSALTAPDAPARYGRTGSAVSPAGPDYRPRSWER